MTFYLVLLPTTPALLTSTLQTEEPLISKRYGTISRGGNHPRKDALTNLKIFGPRDHSQSNFRQILARVQEKLELLWPMAIVWQHEVRYTTPGKAPKLKFSTLGFTRIIRQRSQI